MEQKVKVADIWFWRKMMRLSWTDKLTNEVVLERVGAARQLFEHHQKEPVEIYWARAEERKRDRRAHRNGGGARGANRRKGSRFARAPLWYTA